jgi:curved DNA-binding protein CbpA
VTTRTPYEILGVPDTADEQTIRQAYHHRARQCHPDAGGDPAEMTAVNLAASVLLDKDSRALYDTTGQQQQAHPDEEALTGLLTLFKSVIDVLQQQGEDPARCDVVALMRASLAADIQAGEAAAAQQQAKAAQLEKLARRLRGRGAVTALQRMAAHDAAQQRRQAAATLAGLAGRRRGLELLADASFEVDELMPRMMSMPNGGWRWV